MGKSLNTVEDKTEDLREKLYRAAERSPDRRFHDASVLPDRSAFTHGFLCADVHGPLLPPSNDSYPVNTATAGRAPLA